MVVGGAGLICRSRSVGLLSALVGFEGVVGRRIVGLRERHPDDDLSRGAAVLGDTDRLGHHRRRAARAEPALPARSLLAAITGAACRVLIMATSGFKPRSSTLYPPTLVWPNATPCFFLPYMRRSIESMSTKHS